MRIFQNFAQTTSRLVCSSIVWMLCGEPGGGGAGGAAAGVGPYIPFPGQIGS